MRPTVVELVTFSLKPDAREEAFIADNDAVDTFCRSRPGFVARRLSRDENGQWVDYVEWETMDAAQSAAKAMEEQETLKPWLAAIEMETISMRHLTVMAMT